MPCWQVAPAASRGLLCADHRSIFSVCDFNALRRRRGTNLARRRKPWAKLVRYKFVP
jgi:hypothetical protein